MKLSAKITIFVFVSSMIGILIMSVSSYQVSKTFYKNQLQNEVEYRLKAHKEVIEDDMTAHTIHHVVLMEKRDPDTSFIIFDQTYEVLDHAYPISESQLNSYKNWLKESSASSSTEFVETMAYHIPHIWSFVPLVIEEETVGYLFIDQDTGAFEQAKTQLLFISVLMALLTLVLAGVVTIYLSKRLTGPIMKVRESTRKIAKGDFEVDLTTEGKDEMADLMNHISSMASQLKEYRDSRQQFLSNVSHDLRTPLTYIKAYAAIIKENPMSAENIKNIKDYSTVIHSEATRMERLVNDLFQLMKLDEGNFKVVKEEVDLESFLKNTLQKVKVKADEKGIDLPFTCQSNEAMFPVDPERMEQVIINLLTNSLRYTKPGGHIAITLKNSTKQVMIEIEDNGEGIPKEDLPFIWNRFYRVDKSRSSKSGGSGLGLAITKQIIQLHGGKIDVDSVIGKGTKFTITL
jgi:signal transduction histidine kinase